MEERKQRLLSSIIAQYIEFAEPVGSGLIVEKYNLNVSPATVRNEMMELEREGYIYQPHTSAGRVPTEKGYKFYVENFLNRDLNNNLKKRIFKIYEQDEPDEIKIKSMAKKIAQESNEAVIIAFEAMNIYYTGLSNLFSQPEFNEHRLVCNLSAVIDKMDEVIYKCYNYGNENVDILIGEDNPFDSYCSAIMTKVTHKNLALFMCLLGPMRMDYNKNVGLLEYAREILINSK